MGHHSSDLEKLEKEVNGLKISTDLYVKNLDIYAQYKYRNTLRDTLKLTFNEQAKMTEIRSIRNWLVFFCALISFLLFCLVIK